MTFVVCHKKTYNNYVNKGFIQLKQVLWYDIRMQMQMY